MWVRSEYAGELAVVATWLTALLPWSVSVLRESPDGLDATFTVVNIRFVFVQFHYLFGLSLGDQSLDGLVQFVYEIPAFVPDNQVLEGRIWVAAALFFALMLALSVVYYAREEWLTERSPVDPVRLFGAGFAVLAVVFTAAAVMFYQHQPTVPVGALFMWVFAAILLRVERT
ncbi:DUF7549 family protein [Halosimplex amylolyticum]|uniref:DUF7549 family protein n=1 Tax=Halosimplex amylolyticum TaxID=3396616 RepID=UPI003F54B785